MHAAQGALGTGLLLMVLQGCLPAREVRSEAREPVRWILVERRYGDIAGSDAAGDGRVNPDAVVLAFLPLYPEDLKWEVVIKPEEHFVELIGLTPEGLVSPGEVVTVRVRVGRARPDSLYSLQAVASQSHVTVIGRDHVRVRGDEVASFRFTSTITGRGGLEIRARVVKEEAASP